MSQSTVLNVVHQEGAALMEAIRARADEVLRGPRDADPTRPATPTGPPVVVQLDEVKTKAQPHTGRKEIWAFTAVVRLAGGLTCWSTAPRRGCPGSWRRCSAGWG